MKNQNILSNKRINIFHNAISEPVIFLQCIGWEKMFPIMNLVKQECSHNAIDEKKIFPTMH